MNHRKQPTWGWKVRLRTIRTPQPAPTSRDGTARKAERLIQELEDYTKENQSAQIGKGAKPVVPYHCPDMNELRTLIEEWQKENQASYSALKLCFEAFLARLEKSWRPL